MITQKQLYFYISILINTDNHKEHDRADRNNTVQTGTRERETKRTRETKKGQEKSFS